MSQILKGIVLLASGILNLFPYRWVSGLGAWLGVAFYGATRFRQGVVRENIQRAMGVTGASLDQLVRANFAHYGRTIMDFLLSASWGAEEYGRRVNFQGREQLAQSLDQGRGVYLLSCHLGSWELAIGAISSSGIPLDVVVKRAQSDAVEGFFQWFRKKTGAGIFLETKTHQQILRSLRNNRVVGFVLDQFMGPPIGLPVQFFGHEAGTAAALALLMERHPAPVVLGYGYRDAKGRPCTAITPPLDLPQGGKTRVERMYARTQAFNDAIERLVRKQPEQWLWLHRRWKPYRGEPRWKLVASTVVGMVGMVLVAGCSAFETSQTGIELPPDPKVNVPEFSTVETGAPSSIEEQRTAEQHAQDLGIIKNSSPKKAKTKKVAKKKAKKEIVQAETKPEPYRVLPADRIPFRVGEKMVLDLTWVALPAGQATLEVKQGPKFGNRESFHLWGNVTSSRLVDAIYHVDNTVETFVDSRGLIPYKFLLHMVESKQLKETKVVFDHPEKKAHYWSKRISERWGNEELNKVDDIVPAAKDMWGALYFARTLPYRLNQTYTFPVYEKGKNFDVSLTAVANEIVRTPVGIFQAWKLLAKIRVDNQFKQTGDIFLWVSDDSNRYIVKFEGKIKIGSLKGTLVELKER